MMSTLNAISSTLSKVFTLPQPDVKEDDDVDINNAVSVVITTALTERNVSLMQAFPIYHAVLFLREPLTNGWYRESVRDKLWFIFNATATDCNAILLTGIAGSGYLAKSVLLKYDTAQYGQFRAQLLPFHPTTDTLQQLSHALHESL